MEKTGAFAVFHSYEDENGDEQIKFIGIFSTQEKAEAAGEVKHGGTIIHQPVVVSTLPPGQR